MSSTLAKGLRVLEALAASDSARGISEFARELKLDKSAVQRIFQTLAAEGYIEKDAGTSQYKPTLRLWELGSVVIGRNETRRLVHPILRYAAKTSGLNVYFAWADFPDVIYLDKVEGEKGRPNSSDPGHRIPLHVAASGRAILAFLDQAHIAKAEKSIEKSSEYDSDYLKRLRTDLKHIQQRLFAATERGSTSRINSIAAPVWGPAATTPMGSIVLTSDSATLPHTDFERIGALAVSTGEQATRMLGGVYPIAINDAP
jgi:IclR family KDG regulon transcriptional repressor